MKKREPVSHIMTTDPYVLNLTDGLSHAEILFKRHKVRHLPVVSGMDISMSILFLNAQNCTLKLTASNIIKVPNKHYLI